ncbi:hypothetical protein ACHAQH_008749 [Verticillium albo-atrum]
MATPVSGEHISVVEASDVEATYHLLISFNSDPLLADSVTSFEFHSGRLREIGWQWRYEKVIDRAPSADEAAHAALEAHARNLGLSEERTNEIIRPLKWMSEYLAGKECESQFSGAMWEYTCVATVLLISLCKNIEILYVDNLERTGCLRAYLLHNNYGKLPVQALQKLVSIHSSKDGNNYYPTEPDFLEHLRHFHRLPSLRSWEMKEVMEFQSIERTIFPAGTATLRALSIKDADITSDLLSTLIRAPRALESFTIHLREDMHPDGGCSMFYPKTLGKALQQHASALKYLDLNVNVFVSSQKGSPRQPGEPPRREEEDVLNQREIDDLEGGEDELYQDQMDYWYWIDQAESTGPRHTRDLPDTKFYGYGIGSLREFEALETLALDLKLLVGPRLNVAGSIHAELGWEPPYRLVDALPQSLISLTLYDYEKGSHTLYDGHVAELMETKGDRLPNLQNIYGVDEKVPGESWKDEDEYS